MYAKLTYLNYTGRHVFSMLAEALENTFALQKKNPTQNKFSNGN